MDLANVWKYLKVKEMLQSQKFTFQNVDEIEAQGKGRKLAWQGAWHENAKGAAQLRSFFLKLGHAGRVEIQTYILRPSMRTYDDQ